MAADSAFLGALVSAARAPEIPEALDIYAGLIGSWHAEVRDYLEDGRILVQAGEWHFARVLEGRAVQDVWIVPPRAQRAVAMPRLANRYGSSLRVFDPASGRWRLIWVNPAGGAHDELVGERRGGELLHEGERPDGTRIRWRFVALTAEGFHWLGEARGAGDSSWRLEAEFRARRAENELRAESDLGR